MKRPTRQGQQTAAYHAEIRRIREQLNCDTATARRVYNNEKLYKHVAVEESPAAPAASTPTTGLPTDSVYTAEQLALSPADILQLARLHLDKLSSEAAELEKQQQAIQQKINQWSTLLALRDQPPLLPTAYQEALAEFTHGS